MPTRRNDASDHRRAWRAADDYARRVAALCRQGREVPKLPRRRVRIPLWTIDATGSHLDATVLSQLLFWLCGKRKDGQPRPHPPEPERGLLCPWIATTANELAEQIGGRKKQVESVLPRLRKGHWIGYHPMRYRGRGNLRGLVVSHVWLGHNSTEMLGRVEAVAGDREPSVWLDVWAMHAVDSDITAALVLSRLWYLTLRRNELGQLMSDWIENNDGGDRVVGLMNEELAEQLMLTPRQVKRAKSKLKDAGLIQMPRRNHVVVNIPLCIGYAWSLVDDQRRDEWLAGDGVKNVSTDMAQKLRIAKSA